jgi:ABC-type polysaccharide/polyol phosphate transport system ATPase subunit
MFEKLPTSKVIKKFKISKQKLISLKSRMKSEKGFEGLLHHKWRLKKFNWDIEKGQFVL